MRNSLSIEPLVRYIETIYPDCHYGRREGESKSSRYHEGNVSEFLAGLSGLSKRTLDRIIYRDRERADIDTIDRICCALSIHAVQLYGRAWTHKVCAMCGEEKLLDEFYVNSTRCIACASIAAREAWQRTKEKRDRYQERHREAIRERNRLYREANREKINARKREARQRKAMQVIA